MWYKKQKPTKPKVSQAQYDWLTMELETMRGLDERKLQDPAGVKAKTS